MANCTRFWLIRHAVVEQGARAVLYGRMDVPLCPQSLQSQAASYAALANRLPRGAAWLVTPLQRTVRTAQAICDAGYPAVTPDVEADLIEQDLGRWQGLPHADLSVHLADPAHAFWPLGAAEVPPGGESMEHVVGRVGTALDRLSSAHAKRDVIAVSHGGAIRAAVAHALGVGAHAALHIAVQNLSLTVIERHEQGWRVVTVNESPWCQGEAVAAIA
jgi:broad specificity phosphatase PhoE